MGCCGSKDEKKKNQVGPKGKEKKLGNVQIVVTDDEPKKRERRQLKPEEAPWRRKKEEKPPGKTLFMEHFLTIINLSIIKIIKKFANQTLFSLMKIDFLKSNYCCNLHKWHPC